MYAGWLKFIFTNNHDYIFNMKNYIMNLSDKYAVTIQFARRGCIALGCNFLVVVYFENDIILFRFVHICKERCWSSSYIFYRSHVDFCSRVRINFTIQLSLYGVYIIFDRGAVYCGKKNVKTIRKFAHPVRQVVFRTRTRSLCDRGRKRNLVGSVETINGLHSMSLIHWQRTIIIKTSSLVRIQYA